MVEVVDGTARGMHSTVKQVFSDLLIPMESIIGNSVSQFLTMEYPNVSIVKCSCHLIHLIVLHGALKLHKGLEDLCRHIFNHLHHSSKHQNAYQEFQKFFSVEPNKILSSGQTCWLLLEACVNCILEQYPALHANEDPTCANNCIVK